MKTKFAHAFPLLLALAGTLASAEPVPTALSVAPGFAAEEIFAGGPRDGSWSAMTVDPKGRLVISPFGSEPMLRISLSADGSPPRVERLAVPVTSAMGLLFAFDSFYVNGVGPQGYGLYRLRDTKGADRFDEVKLLRKFEGRVTGEHGSHGLVLGPDQRIYLAQGNHVLPPADVLPTSPYRHWAEDQLLPSANYGVSGGDKAKAPAGHVLRLDADGREVELFAAGFRNIYDLAFDARGHVGRGHLLTKIVGLRQRHGIQLWTAMVCAHADPACREWGRLRISRGYGEVAGQLRRHAAGGGEHRARFPDRGEIRYGEPVPGEISTSAVRARLDVWTDPGGAPRTAGRFGGGHI